MSRITDIFKCNSCEGLLKHPVTLPCGDSVCKEHIDRLFHAGAPSTNIKFAFCKKCNEKCIIPQNGLKINATLDMLLQREIEKLNLNKYQEAKKSCLALRGVINEYDNIKSEPRGKINKDFQKLRLQVDSIRKAIKNKVDELANEMIDDLTQSEETSFRFTATNARVIFKDFGEIKQQLNAWITELDKYEVDEAYCKEVLNYTTNEMPFIKGELTSLDTKLADSTYNYISRHLNSIYLDNLNKIFDNGHTFQFEVEKFSSYSSVTFLTSVKSRPTNVKNLPWIISVDMSPDTNGQIKVGLYLMLDLKKTSIFSIDALYELRILNKMDKTLTITHNSQRTQMQFCATGNQFGKNKMSTYEDLINPAKGFYDEVRDSITAEVWLKIEDVNYENKRASGVDLNSTL